jgi:hypothetical protein
MAGKLVTEGWTDWLTWYLKNVQTSRGADSLYLGLYTDTTEPLITATLSAGLTELSKTGYARIQLLDADWTIAANLATNTMKTFTAGEDWGNVYGSFITNISVGVGTLISVKHFSNGPFNVLNTKTIDITPKILGTNS